MLTALKGIVVFMDGSEVGQQITKYAVSLACQHKAHVIGTHVVTRKTDIPNVFARGEKAMHNVITRFNHVNETMAKEITQQFLELSDSYGVSLEFRLILSGSMDYDATPNSLFGDLVILGYPQSPGFPQTWTAIRLLMLTGVPAIVVPNNWSAAKPIDKVLVAWNGSRQARRAISDAMPFLMKARHVKVLVVDAEKYPERFGDEPGADLAKHLALHGVQAEIELMSSSGKKVANVIIDKAVDENVDLIVIGVYSRSRTTELLFGGVTRTMLKHIKIPLLISH